MPNIEKLKGTEEIITLLLDDELYKDDLKLFLEILLNEELLLPFNGNHLIELDAGDKVYIPLFSDEKQLLDLKYTRLDKVKLEIVIRDIYSQNKYHAIAINPYTHDFIIGEKMVDFIQAIRKGIDLNGK